MAGLREPAAQTDKYVCAHELFEQQVERTPEATAVVCEGQQLTYRELNIRSNRLAHRLREFGAQPEVLVGIGAEPSLDMVIGIVGILKAGSAYVPLDPVYPRERLRFMLEDARPPLLVTQRYLRDAFGQHTGSVFILDEMVKHTTKEDESNLCGTVTVDNPAYVIYTSGSTGKPKGVEVLHQGLCNQLLWMKNEFCLGMGDRIIQKASISFDASVAEIFAPLTTGGELIVVKPGGSQDLDYLVRILMQHKITFIDLPPSLLRLLLGHPDIKKCTSLRCVVSGGEVLSGELRDRFFEVLQADLYNTYGPTETTVQSTFYKCGPRSDLALVPIGRAIANTRVYVLDSNLRAVPKGEVGELYIGGDGVARGYLNRPDTTGDKFIADPWGQVHGARMYRTGDKVSLREDGLLDFVGRVDLQVKIRGFRIELEEVETVLGSHPAVSKAAVAAIEEVGDERLVAFVSSYGNDPENTTELRKYLSERLPAFMVPSLFVTLEKLPLLPNGKLDRKALRVPDHLLATGQPEYAAPKTPIEEELAKIWASVLGLNQVGASDDFFQMGGHSLLAMQMISRVRSSLSADVDIRTLFDNSTVSRMAAALTIKGEHSGPERGGPLLTRARRDGKLPASHREESMWRMGARYVKYAREFGALNVSTAIRLKGSLSLRSLDRALNEIVCRHEILRTTFSAEDGKLWRVISPFVTLPLPLVKVTESENDRDRRVRSLALEEFNRPFDLSRAPLLRATVLELGEDDHLFVLSMHHIISDAWSLEVLLRELCALYEAFETQTPVSLPELPIQYADFAVWQRQWFQGEVLDELRRYWTKQLSGMPRYLQLATDRPRPPEVTIRGASINFGLPREVADALRAMSQREGATLFMTLLAAFMLLLHRHTGETDIVTRVPLAERRFPEVEGLIGSFAQVFILRTDFGGNPTFREVIRRVRDTALGAYAHPGIPPDILMKAIDFSPDPSQDQIFQTMFNLLDEPVAQRIRFLGLQAEQLLVLEEPVLLADFDLHAIEQSGHLFFALIYKADLFSPVRMKELSEQFKSLLAQVSQAPEKTIDDFSLVTPSSAMASPAPTISTEFPRPRLLLEQLASNANAAPERSAIVYSDKTLTFEDLNRLSNQIAHSLIADGLRPGNVVAAYGNCNAESSCVAAAVLKTGAALVFLDPLQPVPLLVHGLQLIRPQAWLHLEADGQILSTIERCLNDLGSRRLRWSLTDLNTIKIPTVNDLTQDPRVSITPDDLAAIVLSRDADGILQETRLTHGHIANLCRWMSHTFQLDQGDRFCLLSRPGNERFLDELLLPLWVGGKLHIPNKTERADDHLVAWMEKRHLTVVHLSPAMSRALEPDGNVLPALRVAFFSGDALTKQDVLRLRELAPSVTCVNIYRPAGVARASGFFSVREPDGLAREVVPLGKGINGVHIFVMTKSNKVAGVGELGEICLRSSAAVAHGGGQSIGTLEERRPSLLTEGTDDLLFRTRDLGRYLPDGSVEFVGGPLRHGYVNGYKLETAEIEATLLQHPAVRQAVVVISGRGTNNAQLAICIVWRTDQRPTIADLREFMQSRLPAFALPSQLVNLEALPLSDDGRVDRRHLAQLVDDECLAQCDVTT